MSKKQTTLKNAEIVLDDTAKIETVKTETVLIEKIYLENVNQFKIDNMYSICNIVNAQTHNAHQHRFNARLVAIDKNYLVFISCKKMSKIFPVLFSMIDDYKIVDLQKKSNQKITQKNIDLYYNRYNEPFQLPFIAFPVSE